MEILGNYVFLSGCGFLTGLLFLVLAVLVLHANPRSRNCQHAFLFNLLVGLWSQVYACCYLPFDSNWWGYLIARLQSTTVILLSLFYTHQVLVLIKKDKALKRFLQIDYLMGAVFILMGISTNLIVDGLGPKLDLPSYLLAGPFFFIQPLYLFINLFFSLFHLSKAIQKAKGYRRNQLSLLFVASLIGFGAGTPGFLLVFDIPVKPVLAPLVSIYPVIVTYAIIKHRFLDIEKLLTNTWIFSLLFCVLLGFVSVILYLMKEFFSQWIGVSQSVSQGIAIWLAMILYGPLKSGLSLLTQRILYQHKAHPEIIFRKLSVDMLHFLETSKLCEEVTKRISEILALERIGFYLRARKNPSFFELQTSVGRFRKNSIHQSKMLIQYLERTKDYLAAMNVSKDDRSLAQDRPPLFARNLKEIKHIASLELASLGAVAAFPIFSKDKLRAILVLGRKRSDASWKEDELQILKSFTRHLALALENAEHIEEIRRSREAISSRERDNLAGALIAAVDHEAKNPLQRMTFCLNGLKRKLSELRSDSKDSAQNMALATLQAMQDVRRYVREINQIIQHLSNLAERKPLSIQEGVRPWPFLYKAVHELEKNMGPKKVRFNLNLPKGLTLVCDPNALDEILTNLLRNALQAIPDEGEITVDGFSGPDETHLTVRDTGVGIPEASLEKIFEPFFTTKRSVGSDPGTGMGLFIVREYLLSLGGQIEARSEPGKGTAFNLVFPNHDPVLERAA